MIFGIVLVVVGSTLLLKALGLISSFQWDIVFAAFLLGLGLSMIAKRLK